MNNINNGGPAFPFQPTEGKIFSKSYYGLTIRDYLAGQALNGFCSNRNYLLATLSEKRVDETVTSLLAKSCYEYADAMLEERIKEPANG